MKSCYTRSILLLFMAAVLFLQVSCKDAGTGAGDTEPLSPEITVWTPLHVLAAPVVRQLGELPMVQEWQKRTGVKLQFRHPSGRTPSDVSEQYNLMLASGKLPDVMIWNWKNVQGGTSKMYHDGTIVRLNEYIERYAPHLKKILNDNPHIAQQLMADNGDIYTIPHLRAGEFGKYRTFSGLLIRQDWLDELGLKAPETIDEWEKVLTAFKEKKGAIPFTLHKDYPISSTDFAGAFGVAGIGGGTYNGFYVNNGKVLFGPLQPAFKDYLSTMRRWYRNGLLDPDFASNDSKTMDVKISSGKAGAYYGYIGGSIGQLLPVLQLKEPKANLAAVPYPVLRKGDQPTFIQTSWEFNDMGAVITKVNTHPEETVKAFDELFSPQGVLLKNFGLEGLTYNMENGFPKYTDLILRNPDRLPVSQAMARYFIANYPFPGLDDDRYNDQYYQLQTQKDALKLLERHSENARDVMLPPVSLTMEEAKDFARIMNGVNTYLSEMIMKIIMGAVPMEAYDQALLQVKGMEIERAAAIQQAALERYKKRNP
jgi:putative aldouronate transport system substrate-binding protein